MHERFTDSAVLIMERAKEEAKKLNHECVGTEHILLGLIRDGAGHACTILQTRGIKVEQIRTDVMKLVRAGPPIPPMDILPQTPRAKRVVEYATEEARNLEQRDIDTAHLLLGLLEEREGIAAQVLMNLGLTVEQVLRAIGGDALRKREGNEFRVVLSLKALEKLDDFRQRKQCSTYAQALESVLRLTLSTLPPDSGVSVTSVKTPRGLM